MCERQIVFAPPPIDVTLEQKGGARCPRFSGACRASDFRHSVTVTLPCCFSGTVVSHTCVILLQSMAQSWLVWQLTRSPAKLSVVAAVQLLPRLLLGTLGGVICDRVDRRRLLIATQTVSMLQSVVFLGLLLAHQLTYGSILVLTLVLGVADTLNLDGAPCAHPALGPASELQAGVALNSAGMNLTQVIGPSLGGVLLGLCGVAGCLAINAISFIGILGVLFAMRCVRSRPCASIAACATSWPRASATFASARGAAAGLWLSPRPGVAAAPLVICALASVASRHVARPRSLATPAFASHAAASAAIPARCSECEQLLRLGGTVRSRWSPTPGCPSSRLRTSCRFVLERGLYCPIGEVGGLVVHARSGWVRGFDAACVGRFSHGPTCRASWPPSRPAKSNVARISQRNDATCEDSAAAPVVPGSSATSRSTPGSTSACASATTERRSAARASRARVVADSLPSRRRRRCTRAPTTPAESHSESIERPEADFHHFSDYAWFALGAAAGFVGHEMGHMMMDVFFGKSVSFVGVSLGPIPFFAIQPCCNLTPRENWVIGSAGFVVGDVSSELILQIAPRLRSRRHAFLKGV